MLPFFIMEETLELEAPQIGERRDMSLSTKLTRGKNDEDVFTFIISSEEEDRHGSVISVDGIDVSHFKKNPVVLFNHNYDRVIGTAFNVQVVGSTLQASVRFDDDEMSQEVKGKVDRGVLKATSIGFIVKEWSFDEDNSVWKIIESELLEFSIVTVPSNRSALIMRDAQVKSLQETIEKLAVTVERLASTQRNDQSDQLEQNEPSTLEEPAEQEKEAELDESVTPVPGEAEVTAEEDQSHDTVADEKSAPSKTTMPIDKAMELARQVVRRKLGKE